jgi:hypothetical protein
MTKTSVFNCLPQEILVEQLWRKLRTQGPCGHRLDSLVVHTSPTAGIDPQGWGQVGLCPQVLLSCFNYNYVCLGPRLGPSMLINHHSPNILPRFEYSSNKLVSRLLCMIEVALDKF